MVDAAEILGGTVTGQAKGKSITLPAVQAMFRILCNRALKGDNRALRGVIEHMLTLEPMARSKAKEKGARDAARLEGRGEGRWQVDIEQPAQPRDPIGP